MRVAPALLAAFALASLACSQPTATAPPPAMPFPQQGAPPAFNPASVQSLQGHAQCAPKEVAPGVWVTFDCGPHFDVSHAIFPTARMKLVTGPLPPMVDHR